MLTVLGILVALLLGAFGVWMTAFGIRGSHVSDIPRCRHCRYDLRGVTPFPDHCPECGRTLYRARAIRTGGRRRSVQLIVAGLLMLIIAGLLMLIVAAAWLTRTDYGRVAEALRVNTPAALLKWRVTEGDFDSRRLAAAELLRRGSDADTLASLVDPLLAVQADRTQPWTGAFGRIIETVWRGDGLTPDQQLAYIREGRAGSVRIDCDPRLPSGQPLELRVVESGASQRYSGSDSFPGASALGLHSPLNDFTLRMELDAVSVDGAPADVSDVPLIMPTPRPPRITRATLPLDLAPGTHALIVTLRFTASADTGITHTWTESSPL
ncbi:MAG: hypothetical protein KDA21_10720, partial [Phycisphaerales bacterium]|nr:hypothetical protein [Phycisphaerales bacterium]